MRGVSLAVTQLVVDNWLPNSSFWFDYVSDINVFVLNIYLIFVFISFSPVPIRSEDTDHQANTNDLPYILSTCNLTLKQFFTVEAQAMQIKK